MTLIFMSRPLPHTPFRARATAVALAAAVLAALTIGEAEAGWLSRLARLADEAGEAGARTGKLGLGALDNAAQHVARLPAPEKGAAALAAHATPEGHWKFVNREGEVFTAATADELARVTSTLAPEMSPGGKLSLYLSEDTVFDGGKLIDALPAGAELHLVDGGKSYRLRRAPHESGGKLLAEAGNNLTIEIADRALFNEAVFHLGRSLSASNVRVIALEPGGPGRLGSVPRFDPKTKMALVDPIDPAALGGALLRIKGQTAILSGRIEGDALVFRGAQGAEARLDLMSLRREAEAADVNLVVLHSPASHQPGGRNWLWQTVEVQGLDEALKRATYGDFLNALAAGSRELTVTASRDTLGRVVLQAVPAHQSPVPLPDGVDSWIGDLLGHTTGNVGVHAVTLHTRDKERQEELDLRVIPGIPSVLQFLYLGSIAFAFLGWEFSFSWWRRLWPPEQRTDYAGGTGYHAARAARGLAFLLVFASIVGMPAFAATMAVQLWNVLTAPFRFIRWILRKAAGSPA
jgi:hypothetical protein